MLVHFTAPKANIAQSITSLRKIVDIIHKQGHSLSRDWIEPAYARQSQGMPRPINWAEVYQQNIEGLTKSDVVIAETSETSFGVGFQIALAIQQKKPILLLRHKDIDNDSLVYGLDDAVVTLKEYDDTNLEKVLTAFLKENDAQLKDMRFNFFIDRKIYNYLRWAAFKTGKTKAEILRELVQNEIDKKNTLE